ncbi:DnaD/DnaB domain-containing replication protein [Gottschalkia acidurici 9a]|uniref:DnaD/DnaB domain-containing replication protein n=1 Tax=Gottschalkia acidurici (strain ATCC 7906 / DSM 604 / BCRC 14475 / CIP 104303 / KCTC 5404 / NCIMB 10678 / 9a) TaxID=1128398 RepID=K0B5Q6_GOTA9|nr:DnaD domain protein [Gottschalkia acidurici]AFS79836.1 DnaD/DnaB domain-containing replication protein [Gottschalkia acidurici 9a]
MSFFIETTDIDLGDTSIENIFLNDFMPMADGTYVKVYLLGFKYAKDNDRNLSISNEVISRHLNIPLSDVLRAWDFWQDKGIIKKHIKEDSNDYDYKVEFLNLKQLYIKNNYKPVSSSTTNTTSTTYTCSSEDLVEANRIQGINEMFKSIDYIVRRPLVPNEKRKILEWLYNYNMSTDVIVKAFFYSIEKRGKKNLNYIEGIIRNWYDMGITNVESLNDYFKNQDEKFYRYDRIMKSLGIGFRQPTESEMKVMSKWFDDWNFSMDLVLKACESSSKTANPSVNYINSILSSWHSKDIKTIDDIAVKDVNQSNKATNQTYKNNYGRSNPSNASVKTKFHNFEQRTSKYTPEELEQMVLRKKHRSDIL